MNALNLAFWSGMVAANFLAAPVWAQKAAPQKSSVPRGADGKPDFTGVWQPGSTIRGSWETANSGTGVGGSGKDPSASVSPSSTARQGEGAPYQNWAAKKVLESFNSRDIDDPAARCLPPGIPRLVSFGLFPVQIVQTPQQIIILYEYGNAFGVSTLNA